MKYPCGGNRTVHYAWLTQYLFDSLDEVQQFATRWLWTYSRAPQHGLGRDHTDAAAGYDHTALLVSPTGNGGNYRFRSSRPAVLDLLVGAPYRASLSAHYAEWFLPV